MRRITGKGRMRESLPWDWQSLVSRDELLKKRMAEINCWYNKRINLTVPAEVKMSVSKLMDQASWIGGSTELRQFGERLHAAIPEDVREQVDALRRARHREMRLALFRHHRTTMSVHNRSVLLRNIGNA